jgi:hypothetical protein
LIEAQEVFFVFAFWFLVNEEILHLFPIFFHTLRSVLACDRGFHFPGQIDPPPFASPPIEGALEAQPSAPVAASTPQHESKNPGSFDNIHVEAKGLLFSTLLVAALTSYFICVVSS